LHKVGIGYSAKVASCQTNLLQVCCILNFFLFHVIRYLDVIVRQKRLSEMATQQLLLDTYNVKTLLLQLHSLAPQASNGMASEHQPSTMYTKLVSAKIAHIEMILKLVGTPEDLLLERFRIMWPEGQPSDLQMLMSLKSTRKNDQQVILEMFGLSVSGAAKAKWSSGTGGSNTSGATASSGIGGASSSMSTIAGSGTAAASAAASAASAAAAMATSSMKSLTQDLSSTARSAVTNLKWSTSTK
jgi:hypothetical protein